MGKSNGLVLGLLIMAYRLNRPTEKQGFTEENEKMFLAIGKAFGAKAIICTGSRAIGLHVPESDYDFIIIDDPQTAIGYRKKTTEVEALLGIKCDFRVFKDKIALQIGWVYLAIKH